MLDTKNISKKKTGGGKRAWYGLLAIPFLTLFMGAGFALADTVEEEEYLPSEAYGATAEVGDSTPITEAARASVLANYGIFASEKLVLDGPVDLDGAPRLSNFVEGAKEKGCIDREILRQRVSIAKGEIAPMVKGKIASKLGISETELKELYTQKIDEGNLGKDALPNINFDRLKDRVAEKIEKLDKGIPTCKSVGNADSAPTQNFAPGSALDDLNN